MGLAYAGISAYWGAGGTWLLGTVGASLAAASTGTALIAVWSAVLLKVGGVLVPILASRQTDPGWRRGLRASAWSEAAFLTLYGFVFTATGLLVQSGLIATGKTADRHALAWHAAPE